MAKTKEDSYTFLSSGLETTIARSSILRISRRTSRPEPNIIVFYVDGSREELYGEAAENLLAWWKEGLA